MRRAAESATFETYYENFPRRQITIQVCEIVELIGELYLRRNAQRYFLHTYLYYVRIGT